jgi:YD repeat-containing protein
MRIRYDPEVDALSISFRDTTVTTQELPDGVALEYDAQGKLVGLEILAAAKRFGDPSTLQQVILEGVGPGLVTS